MRPTGVREALGRSKVVAKGFGKGMAKGLAKGRRHFAVAGTLDASLDVPSLEEIRDMYGFTVRPQHMEKYLECAKVYKEEEIERSNCWENFLHTYSNPGDSEGSFGKGGGGAETVFDEGESYWGSLWAVEQALSKHSGVGNGGEAGVCPYAEELKKLVWGGVPAALRGELWQVFAGAKERWVDGYYQELLGRDAEVAKPSVESVEDNLPPWKARPLEKWASQIEKDLPRTFPGHPILGEDGLGALRRMLTAYARHNPTVGYCQAMNFLAALLLLLMPEENAFWTLTSIIDDYFEGYYTEKMTEAQVDQLVFTELVREQFPKLANHLETVEVEISWFSGAWFLSIYVNILPWECVLRVWDVLLYEGNRSMLFRTALALLEMHAVALLQQRNNGDVLLMLQSMGETTFDSSQLVLSACLGFQAIDEERLQRLRSQHRPAVIAALHKRSLDMRQWRTTNATAKQVIIDATNGSISSVAPPNTAEGEERSTVEPQFSGQKCSIDADDEERSTLETLFSAPKCLNDESTLEPHLSGLKGLNIAESEERGTLKYQLSAPKFFSLEPLVSTQNRFKSGSYPRIDETDEYEETESSDLQEEVSRLRKELDHELRAREEAECRAEGLKHALMEMEKVDHRRQSPAELEELKAQVAHLKQALADKHEQEAATVKVLVRLEQENRKAEDARQRAVEEAEENRQILNKALRRAADELEAMKKRALTAESMLEATEKRAVMAESMLEAIEQQAAEELRAMEKRAVMAESMLEATLDFHSGAGPRIKRGMEPKMKSDESKDNPRIRNHTISRQDGDSSWEKRENTSKLEESEEYTSFTANKTSILGRSFPLRDNKVHAEHEEDDTHNQEVGDSTSVSLNSSPALIRKVSNVQFNSTSPELVKLQYTKRRL